MNRKTEIGERITYRNSNTQTHQVTTKKKLSQRTAGAKIL